MLQAAIKYEQEELHFAKTLLEQGNQADPDVICNQACVLYKEGKYEEATKLFEEGLQISLKYFGPEHPDRERGSYRPPARGPLGAAVRCGPPACARRPRLAQTAGSPTPSDAPWERPRGAEWPRGSGR